MSVSYWKMFAEKIAKGLGEKTVKRLGTSGRLVGGIGAVVGVGFLVYKFLKKYQGNIEKEPAYQEMMILQGEMEKWSNAISCIGREPILEKAFGSFFEGGAINALSGKKVLGGKGVKAPDPIEAGSLVERAADYILETENLLEDGQFQEKRKKLVSRLRRLRDRIESVDHYGPIQDELARIVNEIRPIESGYAARIYDCSCEIQKTLGSNAAWAAISTATLGLVRKPDA